MPLPALVAALIPALVGGAVSYFGSRHGGGEQHDPARIEDPMRDPLTQLLSDYFQDRVGQPRPGYEGELSAPYNEALLSALDQLQGQTQGYNDPINTMIQRFMSTTRAPGWNPLSAGGVNPPAGSGGISPNMASFIASRLGG